MSEPQFHARRATLDDLPALRPLWEAERLDSSALEKRLKEFQVACDAEGKIVGAIGLQLVQQQGLLHSEAYADFALADTLRHVLWERLRTVGRNHSLARVWTRETSHVWRTLGFDPPEPDQLAHFPAAFGAADAGPLFTIKVRDDPFAEMTPEQEEVLLKQHLREGSDRMLRQAKFLRLFAIAAFIIMAIILSICGRYLWRYRQRQQRRTFDR
jgi:N-acetylglutamate synthase-like GNAT family acetyltransferase